MRKKLLTSLTLPTLMTLVGVGASAYAQSVPSQTSRPLQDNDASRQELSRFDQFLDDHREIADQLRKDPLLVNNDEYLKDHPALQTYLQDHPGIREQIKQNPNAFIHEEARYESREDNRDREANRQELAHFDQFLDSHRETAEQLRKDPSLVNNDEFVKNHPALQAYLQDHPEVRQDIKQNPNAFMEQEARYDRREDGIDYDRAVTHRESANFGEFLGGHSNIAQQLSKDPSLVKNQEYLQNHPELQEYLNAHPEVKEKLLANPQGFVNSAQQFSHSTNSNGQGVKTPTTTTDPDKPKQ
jgi:hypothetical protein